MVLREWRREGGKGVQGGAPLARPYPIPSTGNGACSLATLFPALMSHTHTALPLARSQKSVHHAFARGCMFLVSSIYV